LSDHTWSEIETRIAASELFIFLASQFSRDASGQHQELALAFNKIQATKDAQSPFAVVPVVLDGVDFKSLPDELRSINGTTLDAFTVKSTSHYIVQTFFPNGWQKMPNGAGGIQSPGNGWNFVESIPVQRHTSIFTIWHIFVELVRSACLNVIAQKSADYFGLLHKISPPRTLLTRTFLLSGKRFPTVIGT
jgi:hypothetical protein